MKRNIIETVLGAVVLVIGATFLIYASSAAKVSDVSGYDIKASFNEIGALNAGADVRIAGVKIGTVSAVNLNPTTFKADLTLTLADDIEIPTDSNARIASESLMGGAYLAIDPGADENILKKGDSIAFTQSPQNLEQLLGKFIFAVQDSKEKDKQNTETPAATAVPATETPATETP